MRDYGQIQCSLWGYQPFINLPEDEKLLYVYLLTGPHSNGLGCYRLPLGYVFTDTGNSIDTVSKGFISLQEKRLVYRCESTEFVYISKFLKWNQISNKKVAIAREKEFNLIPSNFNYFQLLANDIIEFGKHFSEPFRNRIDTVIGSRSETLSKQEPNRTEPNRTTTVPERDLVVDISTGEILSGEAGW